MIRKKVLSIGSTSATLLVQDTEAGGALRVLRRVSVAGWPEVEVSAAGRMYEELRQARLRGFVPIHTVLLQSSFLSVVASYAAEGDVTTLIEEEESSPLEETSVLRWLGACAMALRQLHASKLFFPGLTTDRLFVDHNTGGSANVLLGVPLPLPVYFAQLQERTKAGVHVQLDYPPEVLAVSDPSNGGSASVSTGSSGRAVVGYHPTLSDVWCLGRLGVVLLTAKGTNMARRSGSTRQLLSRMMADEAATRPSMDSVVQSLVALAGSVTLGQPPWPAQPQATPPATSPTLPSRQPAPQPAPTNSAGGVATAAADRSNGGGAVSCASPNRRPAASTHSSPPPDVPSTRAQASRRHSAVANGSGAGAATSSTPNAASPPPPPPPPPAPAPAPAHRDPIARPPHAPDDSWHRRAGEKFELLQRMNASPPKLHHQHSGNGAGDAASGRASPRLRGSAVGLLNKSPSPRRNSRGGLIDHNTRVLDEMFAEQGEMRRNFEAWQPAPFPPPALAPRIDDPHHLQREAQRQQKLETAARQHEMRKHFTEWQRQNNQRLTDANNVEVIDHDGVVIVAPRPGPPPEYLPVAGSSASVTNTSGEDDDSLRRLGLRSPVPQSSLPEPAPRRAPMPAATSPPPPKRRSRPTTPRTSTPGGAGAGGSTRLSGHTPRSSYPPRSSVPVQTVDSSPRGGKTTALSARGAAAAPALTSVVPHPPRSSDSSGKAMSSPSNDDEKEAGAKLVSNGPRKNAADVGSLAAVSWTIDGIRSTLRLLLRDRDLYGETMQEVSLFVSQPEEARLAARANEVFMKRLRKLLSDDRMYFGAAALCAQLVALEGLENTLRAAASGRPSR